MPSTTEISSLSNTYCSDVGCDDDDSTAHQLFGRTKETLLLHKTLESVLEQRKNGTGRVVIVHGESGVGKTSLVDTLRVPVLENGGCFCGGKFFQNSSLQEPYSAILAAFSDVCDVVAQDMTEERRQEIRHKLGEDGFLLTKAVSNITTFLETATPGADNDTASLMSEDTAAIDLGVNERSLAKFNVACKTFMQAMSSDSHPLVIFFDDIQWMDIGSKQLIELFIADKHELRNVLMVLAYRDEEAHKIDSIAQHGLVNIQLKNLDSVAIYDIVCAATGDNNKPERMQELSELVLKRSEGNPFYAQAFLEMIQREGFMAYDASTKNWKFDVDEIRTSIMMQSDLAEILSRKIELVNPHIQETLKMASMLGSNFSEQLLVELLTSVKQQTVVPEQAPTKLDQSMSVAECLAQAIEIGFVEKIKNGRLFQFTHDKIQTAFQQLIVDQEEVKRLHGIVGRTILALGDETNATMHQAAVHLNASKTEEFQTQEDLHDMAVINLRAAKHCMSKSAFAAARDLLLNGLELMNPDQKWSDVLFDVTFEMTELLARAELVIGNFEGCKKATGDAILHAKSTEMKINSLVLDVEVRLTSSCELNELMHCAKSALNAVGEDIPRNVKKRHVLFKYLKVKRAMRKMTDEQILGLPMMNDRLASTAIRILSNVWTSCVVQDQTLLAFYTALRSMELTLAHGLSEGSPMSLEIYAIVELVVGNGDEAYRYAKLALRLLGSTGCTSLDSSCLTVSFALSKITWRKEPLTKLRTQLLDTSIVAFENADIWNATYSSARAFWIEAIVGGCLHDLESSLRRFWDQLQGLRQDAMLLWVKPTLQFVLNLKGHYSNWKDISVLTGEAMNENRFWVESRNANYGTLRDVIALTLKSSLACYFGYFKEATEFCEEAERIGKQVVLFSFGRLSWLYGLSFAHFELYRDSGKRRHLGKARKYKKLLAKLASDGSSDAETLLMFISVVEMTLKKKVDKQQMLDAMESAVSHISAQRNHCLEGLLIEKVGFDFARRGHQSEAGSCFDRALDIYQNKWCSNAKYQWLLQHRASFRHAREDSLLNPSQIGNVICIS